MKQVKRRMSCVRLVLFCALALGCSSATVSATMAALHWSAPMPTRSAPLA